MFVDETTGELKWEVMAHRGQGQDATAAMSPDGSLVASVGRNHRHWKLWDAASGVLHMAGAIHDRTGGMVHTKGVKVLVFSPCGQWLATGGEDTAVILWDAQTGKAAHRMTGHSRRVLALSFSADGARLASGGDDRSIRLWDVPSGALLRMIPQAHDDVVYSLHFSPANNHTLSSMGHSQNAHIWDANTGQRIRVVPGQRFAVFSPDGRTIATVDSEAGHVLLINAQTGDLLTTMLGHTGTIMSASFSIDGSKLASCSLGSVPSCKVWDPSTGALLRTILFNDGVFSVAWGRDWVRDTQRVEAFAMGHHPRLGAGSQVLGLDEEVLRMLVGKKCETGA